MSSFGVGCKSYLDCGFFAVPLARIDYSSTLSSFITITTELGEKLTTQSNHENTEIKFHYSLDNLLNRTAMSCENYTKTLKGWAENPDTSKQFVTLGAEGLVYGSAGDSYRNYLINEKKWKFNSDIFNSTCNPLIATSETSLSKVFIYPNPFTDSFKIKSENRFKDTDVKIFTMEGKLVFKKTYHSTEKLEIYLNKGLPAGIYNLILSSKNIPKSYKIIKK